MPSELARTTRIKLNFSPEIFGLVERAAEIQGRTVDEFVVTAAQEAAEHTIEETQIIRLSAEDQLLLAKAILNPPEPTAALRRAAVRYRRTFKSI